MTAPTTALCTACRTTVPIQWPRPGKFANGVPVVKGVCGCGSNVARILPRAK